MRKTDYLDWEHILLDTSIIFSYLQALKESNTDDRCVFVKQLIDELVANKSQRRKERNFYVSAVSISEMYDKSTDVKKTEMIVRKMNVGNMTYIPFDTDIAEMMTHKYHPVLGTEKLNAVSREFQWPESSLSLAREWITKDLMILATADFIDCDTALSLDKKTFLPLAQKVDFNCCIAEKENFLFDNNMFETDKQKIVGYKY